MKKLIGLLVALMCSLTVEVNAQTYKVLQATIHTSDGPLEINVASTKTVMYVLEKDGEYYLKLSENGKVTQSLPLVSMQGIPTEKTLFVVDAMKHAYGTTVGKEGYFDVEVYFDEDKYNVNKSKVRNVYKTKVLMALLCENIGILPY